MERRIVIGIFSGVYSRLGVNEYGGLFLCENSLSSTMELVGNLKGFDCNMPIDGNLRSV